MKKILLALFLLACVAPKPKNVPIITPVGQVWSEEVSQKYLSLAAAACDTSVKRAQAEPAPSGPPTFEVIDRSKTDSLTAVLSWPAAVLPGPQIAPINYGVSVVWFRHVQPGYYPQIKVVSRWYTDILSDTIRVVIVDGHGADSLGVDITVSQCGYSNPGPPFIITY